MLNLMVENLKTKVSQNTFRCLIFLGLLLLHDANAVVSGPGLTGSSTTPDDSSNVTKASEEPSTSTPNDSTPRTETPTNFSSPSKTLTPTETSDSPTTPGEKDSAPSDGPDQKAAAKNISELQAFNKVERVKTDCNKLFNAYAQSGAQSKRYAACKLFKSQHTECKVTCVDYATGTTDGGFKPVDKSDSAARAGGQQSGNDSDAALGDYSGSKTNEATSGGNAAGAGGSSQSGASAADTARAKALAAAINRRNQAASKDDDDDGDPGETDPSDSSAAKSSRSARTPSSSGGADDGTGSSQDGSPASNTQASSASNSNSNSGTNRSSNSNGNSDSGSSSATEAAELQKCQSLRDAAIAACNYQDSTDSASQSQGLSSTCDQMRSKGLKSGQSKNDAASQCIAKWNACSNVCASDADTYSDYDDSSTFTSYAAACQALAAKADELNKAATTSLDASDSGLNCMANTSDGSGQGGDGAAASPDKKAAADKAANETCAADPTSSACGQAIQYAAALKGQGQFGTAAEGKGQFDVADGSGLNVDPNSAFAIAASGGAAPTVGAVPGGSGGGAKGGSATQSSSGGGGLAGALAAVASAAADVDKGFLGGIGQQIMNGENPWSNQDIKDMDPERLDRVINSLGGKPIDLKQYLPHLDPDRTPAEIRDQYYKMHVNIFERINMRYELWCRLGRLVGCEDGR